MTSPVVTSPVLVYGPGVAVLDLIGLHGVHVGGRGWLLQGVGGGGLLEVAQLGTWLTHGGRQVGPVLALGQSR